MTRIDQADLLATMRAYIDTARTARLNSQTHPESIAQPMPKRVPQAATAPVSQVAQQSASTERAGDIQAALGTVVAKRVGALSMDDPQRRRKAFRFYLEAILTNEFGAALLGDHDFERFVEQVLARMEKAPRLAQAIDEAGALLLAESGHGSTQRHRSNEAMTGAHRRA